MIVKYEHHGTEVFVDSELKGTHRSHCLCFKCANFKIGDAANCEIAKELYALCVNHDLVTPVFECPKFVQV
jgi:hypothetical protein